MNFNMNFSRGDRILVRFAGSVQKCYICICAFLAVKTAGIFDYMNMKKTLTSIALTLIMVTSALAQTGTWSGRLTVQGMELTLVFRIDGDTATLDVPDQGAEDIPVAVERSSFGRIRLSIPTINASYDGLWTGKLITGTFIQHGVQFPLTLSTGAPVPDRPQTPVGPFSYADEEVAFSNGDAVLRGTLTMPEKCDRNTPVLIMVTGSGLQNRDEAMFGHKPFLVIADAFARAGIATLRYDDRGFGESTGDVLSCTTEDFKNDALAGIRLLRRRFDHVGVLGHSEGGSIALMLAAEGNADFIISLAGMVVSGAETLLEQNRRALADAGIAQADVDSYCRLLSDTYDAVKAGLPLPSPESHDLPEALKQNLIMASRQLLTPYMRYFLAMDLARELGGITCPVMALNGTMDVQVSCERNLDAIRNGLPATSEGGHKNVVKAEDGLNHLFQHCSTGNPAEYKAISETFSPEVISEMVTWIKSLF